MKIKFWSENLKEGRDHTENLGVDVRIILDWTVGKQIGKLWTEYIWPRLGTCG